MKKIITYTVILTLILAIAGSSSGLFLNKMICLESGNTFYSLDQFECCEEDDAETALKARCCDYVQAFFKMEVESLPQIKDVPVFDFLPELPIRELRIPGFQNYSDQIIRNTGPPLIHGAKHMTALLQVYRL